MQDTKSDTRGARLGWRYAPGKGETWRSWMFSRACAIAFLVLMYAIVDALWV